MHTYRCPLVSPCIWNWDCSRRNESRHDTSTLNTLHALSLDQSSKAPKVILKLADLMGYILYECHAPRVPLAKELAFLENYLELERLRVAGKMQVHLHVVGVLNGQQVAPLLFMSLVENAFKHGGGHHTEGAFLHILLHIKEEDGLAFRVENSTARALTTENEAPSGGIGLQNIQKRLALLYPDMHQFDTRIHDGLFRAQLTIPAH